MKLQIQRITDNRFVQVIFLPIAIYNIIHSLRLTIKQSSIFKSVLNSNDNFFKSLVTLGITKDRFFYGYTARYEYDESLFIDTQMILETAREKIIDVVMEYVRDDNLLGVIQVAVDIDDDYVVMRIIPTQWNLLIQDIKDTVWGVVIWSVVLSALYFFL